MNRNVVVGVIREDVVVVERELYSLRRLLDTLLAAYTESIA